MRRHLCHLANGSGRSERALVLQAGRSVQVLRPDTPANRGYRADQDQNNAHDWPNLLTTWSDDANDIFSKSV